MIYYLSPGSPNGISGGTRKLYDHVAILNQRGLEARIVSPDDIMRGLFFDNDRDVIVVPEVFGDGVRDFVPRGWRRIVFVQNSYLTDRVDGLQIVEDVNNHPYLTCPELIAIFTESAHTTDRLRWRFPDLKVPLIRTHSSGNGRNGELAGFRYGAWPRAKRVCYFDYKHERDNKRIFDALRLPDGWEARTMTGLSDDEIVVELQTAAIFAAANVDEGMCAPTSEAMISGAVIVCWTGHGPDEYLVKRSVIAEQDDVDALRDAIVKTAKDIDARPKQWAAKTRDWSEWFCETYGRERECDELVDIFEGLLA
jgi:hypothetical protein